MHCLLQLQLSVNLREETDRPDLSFDRVPASPKPPRGQSPRCAKNRTCAVGEQRRALARNATKNILRLVSSLQEASCLLRTKKSAISNERLIPGDGVPQSIRLSAFILSFSLSVFLARRDLEARYIDPQPYSTRPAAAHSRPI